MPSDKEVAYWRSRAFANWKETGLPQEDRHEFVEKLLRRDVRSWRELTMDEWPLLVAALEGWAFVQELRRQVGLVDDRLAQMGVET